MLYALSDYHVSLVYSLILSFISFLYIYIIIIIIIALLIGEFSILWKRPRIEIF